MGVLQDNFIKKITKSIGKATTNHFNEKKKKDFFTDNFLQSLEDGFSVEPFGPP